MPNLSHLPSILIVEDEALILLDLQQTLEDSGATGVVTATSIEEALAAIEARKPDCAVLDLHLGRSGWSYPVAHRLKELGVPFVFSSGTVEVTDGFHDVPLVMKPFSSDQLLAALIQVTAEDANEAAE